MTSRSTKIPCRPVIPRTNLAESQRVTVGASSPGRAAFTARAFRSISGRVLRYDHEGGRVCSREPGAQVTLIEPGLITVTDPMGRYLFRDLSAGSYTMSVQNEPPRAVRLGDQPVDLVNIDFQMSGSNAVIPTPAQPTQVGQAVSPALPVPIPAHRLKPVPPLDGTTAQQHNTRGRQLTK